MSLINIHRISAFCAADPIGTSTPQCWPIVPGWKAKARPRCATPHAAEGQDMNAVVPDNESITLDLTGPGSHSVLIEPGRGSFALGPEETGRRLDAIVPLDAPINW